MGFVNRILEEDERREYILAEPRKGVVAEIIAGTIDDDNDVRLFRYANGYVGKREPCDIYSFVFDYKGKVYYIHLRRTLDGDHIYWSFHYHSDMSVFTEEELTSLREAMKVYAYEGFNSYDLAMKEKDPSYVSPNDETIVHIEF